MSAKRAIAPRATQAFLAVAIPLAGLVGWTLTGVGDTVLHPQRVFQNATAPIMEHNLIALKQNGLGGILDFRFH